MCVCVCRALKQFGGQVPPSEYDEEGTEAAGPTNQLAAGSTAKASQASSMQTAELLARVRTLEEQLEEAQAQADALKAGPLAGGADGPGAEGAEDSEVLCSVDGHGCDKGASKARKLGEGSSGGGGASASMFGPGGWLGPWQAKASVSVNLVLSVIVLMLVTAPRRRRAKTLRNVQ